MYNQTNNVNIKPKSYLPEFHVSQNDVGRTLTAHLVSDDGDVTIPAGATVTMAGTKPSGLGYTVTGTTDGSDVSFDTDAVMTDEPGRIVSEIRIVQGDTLIGTTNVVLSVEPDPHPDDTTDGRREPLINEITALLRAIEEQAEQVADDARAVEQAMDAWTNMTAEATTLPAGSEASASYSDGELSLGIPAGPEGAPGQDGQDGVGIASVALNSDYTLTITLTDGRTYTTTSIRGEQGETGLTPDFSIGTVTTLAPGSQATATITGTDEEPVLNLGIPKGDTGEVSLETLAKVMVSDTASGTIASFADGSDALPAKSVLVTLEPIQDLHGYDKPWVGGAGKNKLPMDLTYIKSINTSGTWNNNAYTRNDVTFTINDNSTVTVNGTATSNAIFYLNRNISLLQTGTEYKLNGNSGAYAATRLQANFNGATGGVSYEGIDASFTTPAEINTMDVYIAVLSGQTVSNLVIHPMIRLATESDATFASWENICPISGWDEVEVVVSSTQSADDGTAYTTTLPQTVYGGTLDVVSGVLTVDRAMETWTGSDITSISTDGGVPFARIVASNNVPQISGSELITMIKCNAYTPTTTSVDGGIVWVSYTQRVVRVFDSRFTDLDTAKAILNAQPIQYVYPLATPTTIQCDPQTVQTLMGDNNVWGGDGVSIDYYADTKLYIEKMLGA